MAKRRRYKSYAWTHPKTRRLYARVQIQLPDGTSKTFLKPAVNRRHAEQLAGEIFAEYSVRKTGFLEGETMTFDDLAKWYLENRVIPPVYAENGTKIEGMRTYRNVRLRIERLQKYLGKLRIKEMDEDVLFQCKKWLKRQSPDAKPASINRYLEDLRAMLRIAVRRRWLRENPFEFGEKLIDSDLEERRDVILNEAQENLILETARQSGTTLLYYALLCLLETGARPSEIYDASTVKAEPIKWRDFFDHDFKALKLTSYKGKQKKIRFAPVSTRLELAMSELWSNLEDKNENAQIFEVKSFRTAWRTLCRKAGIENVRMRDLRRSFSTKLANLGIENDLRQRILGHEQAQTTFDYTSANLETALKIREKLNELDVLTFGKIS